MREIHTERKGERDGGRGIEREEIEMEEREITELANMKIAWRWYSRVTCVSKREGKRERAEKAEGERRIQEREE